MKGFGKKRGLKLSKETLRGLHGDELAQAGGGWASSGAGCRWICGPTDTCDTNCEQATCGCYAVVNWGNLYFFKG